MAGSIAIFSFLGYGAHILNKPIESVVEAGPGFVFVVYPNIITRMPGSTYFSIIFFLMIVCIGFSSQFNYSQTVLIPIQDRFPDIRVSLWRRAIFLGIFCSICAMLGLPLICPGGPRLLEIIDQYSGTWTALFCGVFECLAISWLYGFKNYSNDLRLMMPWFPKRLLQAFMVTTWGVCTPLMLTVRHFLHLNFLFFMSTLFFKVHYCLYGNELCRT